MELNYINSNMGELQSETRRRIDLRIEGIGVAGISVSGRCIHLIHLVLQPLTILVATAECIPVCGHLSCTRGPKSCSFWFLLFLLEPSCWR